MTVETTIYRPTEGDDTSFLQRQSFTQDAETKKIKNATLRDRRFQDERNARDIPAHVIMEDYRRAAISKEQAIYLMFTNCARSRGTTLLIMEKSGADAEHRLALATLQMEEHMLLVLEGRA